MIARPREQTTTCILRDGVPAKKKSIGELRAENRFLRRLRGQEGIVSVFNNLVRWGGIVLIGRYLYLSILALAGRVTLADIGLNFLANVRVSEAVAWLLGGGGVAYGWQQRKVRKDTVERLAGRIQEKELKRDPGRTSSKLTTRGDTRPEDKI